MLYKFFTVFIIRKRREKRKEPWLHWLIMGRRWVGKTFGINFFWIFKIFNWKFIKLWIIDFYRRFLESRRLSCSPLFAWLSLIHKSSTPISVSSSSELFWFAHYMELSTCHVFWRLLDRIFISQSMEVIRKPKQLNCRRLEARAVPRRLLFDWMKHLLIWIQWKSWPSQFFCNTNTFYEIGAVQFFLEDFRDISDFSAFFAVFDLKIDSECVETLFLSYFQLKNTRKSKKNLKKRFQKMKKSKFRATLQTRSIANLHNFSIFNRFPPFFLVFLKFSY